MRSSHFSGLSDGRPDRITRSVGEPWVWYAVALTLTVAGFWPTFFAQLATQDVIHLVHGLTATAWMVAAVSQAWLVKRRRYAAHRRAGRWLLLLPPVIVLSGFQVVQVMLARNREQVELVRFKFARLDIGVLVLFVVFVVLAIISVRRRDVPMHLRWMGCTAILALEPALERLFLLVIPVAGNFDDAPCLALLCVEGLLLVLIAREWHTGRVRVPYPVLLAFFVVVHVLATPVASNPRFQSLAMRLASD